MESARHALDQIGTWDVVHLNGGKQIIGKLGTRSLTIKLLLLCSSPLDNICIPIFPFINTLNFSNFSNENKMSSSYDHDMLCGR